MDKRIGRTWPDMIIELLTEHINKTLLVLCTFMIFTSVIITVFHLQFSQKKSPIPDIILKPKKYANNNNIGISDTFTNSSIKKIKKDYTSLKNQNTKNINTGINNGIIGDNSVMNISNKQRHLDEELKKELLQSINRIKVNRVDDCRILVSSVMGNSEAFYFAKEILMYLQEIQLDVCEEIGEFCPATQGITVEAAKGNHIDIYIGHP